MGLARGGFLTGFGRTKFLDGKRRKRRYNIYEMLEAIEENLVGLSPIAAHGGYKDF